MRLDPAYSLPTDVDGVLRVNGEDVRGPLRTLLKAYDKLPATARRHAVMMFDRRIEVPIEIGKGRGNERLNLFDGEGDMLLPYLD